MLRGLYTVSTVLEQNNKTVDVMANNLANLNTTAYKRDMVEYEEFNSVLLAKTGGGRHYALGDEATVKVEQKSDSYRLTTNSGYFSVAAPGGRSYNRALELRRAEDGTLKTLYRNGYHEIIDDAGYQVMGQNGAVTVASDDFEIDEKGRVLVAGEVVDTLLFDQPKDIIGSYSGGINFRRKVTDFEQGAFNRTDNPHDIALQGRGFIAVETAAGTRYTRNGHFKVDDAYHLLTNEGYPVLGLEGPITLSSENLAINEFGELLDGGLIVDKLNIVNPQNIERMQKVGENLYRFDGGAEAMQMADFSGQVLQGYLEGSNVNSLTEMIQIIETYRAYEGAQRIVRAYDDTLDKAVNQVGQL